MTRSGVLFGEVISTHCCVTAVDVSFEVLRLRWKVFSVEIFEPTETCGEPVCGCFGFFRECDCSSRLGLFYCVYHVTCTMSFRAFANR